MQVVEINEQTKLPLGLVAGSFITFAGLIFWLTVLYSDVAQAKKELQNMSQAMDILRRIEVRLANVEGKVDILASSRALDK